MLSQESAPFAVRRLELVISPAYAGVKVDTLLRKQLHLSGSVIRRMKYLPDGILLDGVRINTRCRPIAGQVLSVRLSDPAVLSGILPVPGTLDILYEDEDLLVVNKAPGVAVHPGPGHHDDTLGNFLLHYYQQRGIPSDFHPVHRLDRGTSGLMVVAKHPHAQDVLRRQLHTSAFHREYLAICTGLPQPLSGLVDAPIGREADSIVKRRVCPDGAPARTRYTVLQSSGTLSLLRVTLETGRTHQIRVHMAHIGHPLLGDFLYGEENPALLSRPALHSARLELIQPVTSVRLSFHAPLPPDFTHLLSMAKLTPASVPKLLQSVPQSPDRPDRPWASASCSAPPAGGHDSSESDPPPDTPPATCRR